MSGTGKKTFVLDTSVLLHDPDSISQFPRHNVVIPLTVLEELDYKKKNMDELGANARRVIRFLDGLKARHAGNWNKGIELENKSRIWIELETKWDVKESFALDVGSKNDNKIIMTGYLLMERGHRVVFVSKDFAARIKAEALGLEAQDYENLKVAFDNIYHGMQHIDVTGPQIESFHKDGYLTAAGMKFVQNEYALLKTSDQMTALGKFNSERGQIVALNHMEDLWGVKARNQEQRCALDMLMNDKIQLITLVGPAGTGKTLLALAAGLRKVFDEGVYSRILVSRPIIPLGKDIGYLPGTKEEKLFSWMQPIYDNLAFLCDASNNESNETLRWVTESSKLEMEAVTYIRGRSLPKMYIIIDEAQNLTPHEVKTIISRAGDGTKVILCGDPTQIDNPYLDKDSNGLSFTVGKFKNQSIYGHIFLEKTERSQLAALAAEIM